MDVISPEHEQEYFKRARTFEVGLLEKAEQTNKRLWLALAAVIVLCCCSVAAVIAVVSMKEVFPFLITQYSDGRIETTDMTSNPQKTYDEVMNEYWVRMYVSNRENWNYSQAQSMFDTVQLLNAPEQQKLYQTESDPKNKKSKSAVYGQREDAKVNENSAPVLMDYDSKTGRHIMTYRWKRVVASKVDNRSPEPTNFVSTVTFRYNGVPSTPAVRKINPLGFQVLDYRADVDQGGALQ